MTAMALGAARARAGKTCLLVDLDPQEHCTPRLGLELHDGEPIPLRELFTDSPLPIAKIIINEAQIDRTDIFSFEARSKGAVAYEAFVMEILTYGK